MGGASANSLPEEQTDRPPTPNPSPPRARARGGRGAHRATTPRSRRGFRASFSGSFRPLNPEGAGNAGRPMRPKAACATVVEMRTRVSQVTPANTRHSPRSGLRLMSYSPRRSGFFVTVIPEKPGSQELDASVEASGPYDFAVRQPHRPSSAQPASTASRSAFRDVAQRPSEWSGTAGDKKVIWGRGQE